MYDDIFHENKADNEECSTRKVDCGFKRKEKKRKETEVREISWALVKRFRIEELLLWMKWFRLVLGLSKPNPHFKWIPKKLIKPSK